jgi:hypothetical protein
LHLQPEDLGLQQKIMDIPVKIKAPINRYLR